MCMKPSGILSRFLKKVRHPRPPGQLRRTVCDHVRKNRGHRKPGVFSDSPLSKRYPLVIPPQQGQSNVLIFHVSCTTSSGGDPIVPVDIGKTAQEKDRLIQVTILCLCIGIVSADVLIPLGFVIWILVPGSPPHVGLAAPPVCTVLYRMAPHPGYPPGQPHIGVRPRGSLGSSRPGHLYPDDGHHFPSGLGDQDQLHEPRSRGSRTAHGTGTPRGAGTDARGTCYAEDTRVCPKSTKN